MDGRAEIVFQGKARPGEAGGGSQRREPYDDRRPPPDGRAYARRIYLQVLPGEIRYSAPQGAPTADLKRELAAHKPEILAMCGGNPITDVLNRLADLWCADIEATGEGDAAWSWMKTSDHWQIISAAEDNVNRIGNEGNPDELQTACREWIVAWAAAMAAWRGRHGGMDPTKIVEPGAAQRAR